MSENTEKEGLIFLSFLLFLFELCYRFYGCLCIWFSFLWSVEAVVLYALELVKMELIEQFRCLYYEPTSSDLFLSYRVFEESENNLTFSYRKY